MTQPHFSPIAFMAYAGVTLLHRTVRDFRLDLVQCSYLQEETTRGLPMHFTTVTGLKGDSVGRPSSTCR